MSEYSAPTQFIDLAAQQKLIRPQLDAAIKKVLDHGQYIMGPEVKEFESQLREVYWSQACSYVCQWHRCTDTRFDGLG